MTPRVTTSASAPRRNPQRLFGQLPRLMKLGRARVVIGLDLRYLMLEARLGISCELGSLVLQGLELRIDSLVHGIDARLCTAFCSLERSLSAGNRSLELVFRFTLGLRQLCLQLIDLLLKSGGVARVLKIDLIST